jgi:hypothetical protein
MSTFDFVSQIAPATAVSLELQNAWTSGLIGAATTKIAPRWNAIVGTAALWTKNVSDPSNRQWKGMVNPRFTSRSGRSAAIIIGLQRKKLDAAFTKAKTAYDKVFANGAAEFTTAVGDKATNWTQNAANSLGMTGDRLVGVRGPASQHVRAAAGDSTFLRDVQGTPYTGVLDPTTIDPNPQVPYIIGYLRQAFKAAFEGLLIQYGVLLMQQVVTDPLTMNLSLDTLLKGFMLETENLPPASFIRFEVGNGIALHTHLDNNDVLAS